MDQSWFTNFLLVFSAIIGFVGAIGLFALASKTSDRYKRIKEMIGGTAYFILFILSIITLKVSLTMPTKGILPEGNRFRVIKVEKDKPSFGAITKVTMQCPTDKTNAKGLHCPPEPKDEPKTVEWRMRTKSLNIAYGGCTSKTKNTIIYNGGKDDKRRPIYYMCLDTAKPTENDLPEFVRFNITNEPLKVLENKRVKLILTCSNDKPIGHILPCPNKLKGKTLIIEPRESSLQINDDDNCPEEMKGTLVPIMTGAKGQGKTFYSVCLHTPGELKKTK